MTRPIVAPRGHATGFVELFFDLVFVFSVTQVVSLLSHDLSWTGVGRAILVFWLVWWAWTQFTWALNSADTTHPFVELGTLVATAVAFFMAVSIPGSFVARSLGFAVTYVTVRTIGLVMYAQVARANDPGQHAAVRLFSAVSSAGLLVVLLGGLVGGGTQTWLWGLAVVFDVVAALIAGSSTQWGIHAEHFAERHGLIVIIALGESLIIAAAGLADASFAGDIVLVALLGVLLSCALWWTYFPVVKPQLEHSLVATPSEARGALARDVYSLAHFPMLCGIVACAVALEGAVTHPEDALGLQRRAALAVGVLLFVGGTGGALRRAGCGNPLPRLLMAAVTSTAVMLLPELSSGGSLAIALAGTVSVAVADEWGAGRLEK